MTTTTLSVPPISQAGIDAATAIYKNAKTTKGEDVIQQAADLHAKGMSRADQELLVHAYSHGGGNVSDLVNATKSKRGDPAVAAYLRALKAERAPENGERDNVACAAIDYRIEVAIASKIKGGDAATDKTVEAKLKLLETALGRQLTAEEKTAFAA